MGSGPQGVSLADLNKDGNLDIIVADAGDTDASRAIAVRFLGKSDGTFAVPPSTSPASVGTISVTAVDLNGDGRGWDLAAVSPHNNLLSLYYGLGNGTFRNPVNYSTANYTIGVPDTNLTDYNPTYVASLPTSTATTNQIWWSPPMGKTGGYIELLPKQGRRNPAQFRRPPYCSPTEPGLGFRLPMP